MKEKQLSKDIASAENIIRHAYNQGYEQGLKASKQEPCEDWRFYFNQGYEQARKDFIKLVDKYRNGGSE